MGNRMQFNYYYGIEAEQFSFYRVPRLLVKDERFKGLSSDAKLLYGLMLDRMSLSMKNGWLDDEQKAYIIYTIENIMEDLGCSKPTCVKIMRELDSINGIGLIEKKRRGLGKPDIIYVKNFASVLDKEDEEKSADVEDATESPEVKNLYFRKEKNLTSEGNEIGHLEIEETEVEKERNLTSGRKETELLEVKEVDFQKLKKFTSESKELKLQEVKNFSPNYNNINYTDMSKIYPIHQSGREIYERGEAEESEHQQQIKKMDVMDDGKMSRYRLLIRNNLEYEYYIQHTSCDERELLEEIYKIICDVVCVKRKTLRINGEDYPYELVKSCFLKLNHEHVQYVMDCMKENSTKITNIRAYLLTALYNAPSTMNHYYQQKVQHDIYGGGWKEKGVV